MTLFGARSSRDISALSVPPMMKYPPGSQRSSPLSTRCLSSSSGVGSLSTSRLSLCRLHFLDLIMTGRSPMCTFSASRSMPSSTSVNSSMMGEE